MKESAAIVIGLYIVYNVAGVVRQGNELEGIAIVICAATAIVTNALIQIHCELKKANQFREAKRARF